MTTQDYVPSQMEEIARLENTRRAMWDQYAELDDHILDIGRRHDFAEIAATLDRLWALERQHRAQKHAEVTP